MRLPVVLGLVCWIASTVASPSYVVHETVSPPAGYKRSHQPDPNTKIHLRVYLAQPNLHLLPDWLMNVSHPESAHYGKHWAPQRVADTFHNEKGLAAVREWLVEMGYDSSRVVAGRSATWVGLKDATVQEVEDLLKCQYWVYNGPAGQPEHIGMTKYFVPANLTEHIDFVLNAPPPHRKGIVPVTTVKESGQANISKILEGLDNCENATTPVCLRSLYGITYEPKMTDKNTYGIVEYTPQAFVQSDLDLFFDNFSADAGFVKGFGPQVVGIDGGYVQTGVHGFGYNGESNLDLQYGMELVSSKQPVTLYQVGDFQEGASFNNFLDALDASYCGGDDPLEDATYPDSYPGGYKGPPDCGTSKPANVISTSYGYDEAQLPAKYMERQCLEYAKLGLMGVSVVYSSGDSGVAGNYGACLDDHGNETYSGQRFNPGFPSSCPWITSVGATQVTTHPTYPNAESGPSPSPDTPRYVEQACEKVIYSGGGFSNVFKMPSYQNDSVNAYLNSYASTVLYGSAPGYRWNNTGTRAFPDISANGANYVVAVNGRFSLVYGTSASSPVVGAILTLINDARIATGKGPVGFVNPSLYHPSFKNAFHDITRGANPGCGTGGFNAVPGWDPTSGIGTPKFANLLNLWVNL